MRLILLLILFPFASLTAQQGKLITGVVKNAKGELLSGVSVVESAKNETTTDAAGKFSLTLKSAATKAIQFSYVGYVNRSMGITGRSEMNVELKENEAQNPLDEVIIDGTQQQNRRNTVASLSSVTSKQIENLPSASVDVLLQGRISGMNVQVYSGEPGVAPTMTVRGNSKVNVGIGDNDYIGQAQAMSGPLYVIDGMPLNPDDLSNTLSSTGTIFLQWKPVRKLVPILSEPLLPGPQPAGES